jgi:hypothetical protein
MCKNWIETGFSRYATKCQFAHGGIELNGKVLPLNAKYKSKLCNTFSEGLFCPYANRCLFRHEDRAFEEVHYYHWVTKLLLLDAKLSTDKLVSGTLAPTKRLPIF